MSWENWSACKGKFSLFSSKVVTVVQRMKEIDAVGACICLSCKLFSNRNATITYCNIKGSRTHVRSTCQLKTLSHAAICLFNCKLITSVSNV